MCISCLIANLGKAVLVGYDPSEDDKHFEVIVAPFSIGTAMKEDGHRTVILGPDSKNDLHIGKMTFEDVVVFLCETVPETARETNDTAFKEDFSDINPMCAPDLAAYRNVMIAAPALAAVFHLADNGYVVSAHPASETHPKVNVGGSAKDILESTCPMYVARNGNDVLNVLQDVFEVNRPSLRLVDSSTTIH